MKYWKIHQVVQWKPNIICIEIFLKTLQISNGIVRSISFSILPTFCNEKNLDVHYFRSHCNWQKVEHPENRNVHFHQSPQIGTLLFSNSSLSYESFIINWFRRREFPRINIVEVEISIRLNYSQVIYIFLTENCVIR